VVHGLLSSKKRFDIASKPRPILYPELEQLAKLAWKAHMKCAFSHATSPRP